jgi:hypothetical protein
MSNYLETDFCTKDDGLDYIFAVMGATYGAAFSRHFEGMDLDLVRSVWGNTLGGFLTYKPSLHYAIRLLPADFPPSAVKFKEFCNAGPNIPVKPIQRIERQPTLHERMATDKAKAEALARLAQLRKEYGYK